MAWRVRRRWLPHSDGRGVRMRLRRRRSKQATTGAGERDERRRWYDAVEVVDGCLQPDGIVVVIVGLVVVLLVLFGPGIALLGVDLAWLLVVFLGGLIGRVLLGRPWSVEATSDTGERREWKVRGFADAGRLRDVLQAELDAGLDPHPELPIRGG